MFSRRDSTHAFACMSSDNQIERGFEYNGHAISIKTSRPVAQRDACQDPEINACSLSSIFLGSTVHDLDNYRREVQDALLKRAGVACFLSEDWITDYEPTVDKCQQEVEKADGYIGIFAYWYGSIPPNFEQSITHLEFQWAFKKWNNREQIRLAVLMPKSPSRAETKLRKKAAELLVSSGTDTVKHAQLLQKFHEEVKSTSWRMVHDFRDKHELREKVIVIGLRWKGFTPTNAAKGRLDITEKTSSSRTPSEEELGLLGRRTQLDAVRKILSQTARYDDVPAIAMLVHGDEDSGQRLFLRQLLLTKHLRSARPTRPSRPPLEQYDVSELIQWVGNRLGVLTEGQKVDTPEELAEQVGLELQEQQLCLVLDELHRLPGGAVSFHKLFWRPFYKCLSEQKPAPYRLITILVDYTDRSSGDNVTFVHDASNASSQDFSRLLLLPRLEPFTEADLFDWFDELDVPDRPHGRRAQLVDIILKNPQGEYDGTPLRVFERLRDETLWPEE